MTLANKITLLRILLIPLIVIALLNGEQWWSLGLYAFSALTDALDGFIARYFKQKTPIGSFLDPSADKLLLTAIFLTLAYLGTLPKWVFVIVFSRDVLIVLGWFIIFFITGSSKVEPRHAGKATTFLQMATVLASMMQLPSPWLDAIIWVMVLSTALSAIDYVLAGSKQLAHLERA